MDKKIKEIDIMVTLLESKLNSLPPEITSKYPELGQAVIPEVKPNIDLNQPIQQNLNNKNISEKNEIDTSKKEEAPVVEEKKEEEIVNDPIKIFENFIEENPDYETYYKMVKYKIPVQAVEQKAMREGMDMDKLKVK